MNGFNLAKNFATPLGSFFALFGALAVLEEDEVLVADLLLPLVAEDGLDARVDADFDSVAAETVADAAEDASIETLLSLLVLPVLLESVVPILTLSVVAEALLPLVVEDGLDALADADFDSVATVTVVDAAEDASVETLLFALVLLEPVVLTLTLPFAF